jgi:uroporphyrin-III C-methyltransferase
MTVYLVGAGPGDPGLITVRGLELVRSCDAIVHDRLVSSELVAEAPPDAIRIGRELLSQAEIEALLVRLGRRGLDVVRLKGGDPFVFGRGGEEALALAAAGVPFEVVPGVSSLSAVPASAGIPITHRDVSSQVTVVSGHDARELDFAALARAPGTHVIFMGLASLAAVAQGLIREGMSPDTPAAVVSSGTMPEQRTVAAPLSEIADAAASLDAPALVVIGDVVALAGTLTRSRDFGDCRLIRAPATELAGFSPSRRRTSSSLAGEKVLDAGQSRC